MSLINEDVPVYLKPYIVQQDPSLYTPIDHAGWRYILKISKAFLSQHAHQIYLDGIPATGMSAERIPLIEEMDTSLKKLGWRAVAVSGFVPPAVFMEFLSLGILPIACDMRKIEHLSYTPAPDIVHEAAGHAPILADPTYARYLKNYGEISQKAIITASDMAVYNAIRKLSDLKEDPRTSPEEVELAQGELDEAMAQASDPSEATWLSRMGWWTFEYGLIGTLADPKIYGAGLLSSVGESYHCLDPSVKKIPFSIDCIEVPFDITRPQPHLFVTGNFDELTDGLKQLASKMAFKKGGREGLERARKSAYLTTTELDSGIQVSGILDEFLCDSFGSPIYLKYRGPCQIAFRSSEIEGQGVDHHPQGFGTPVGKLKNGGVLQNAQPGQRIQLNFVSGVHLEGRLDLKILRESRDVLVRFVDCTVRLGDRVLFDPAWGVFDLVLGEKVVSVFGGAADRAKYLDLTGGFKQAPHQPKTNLTPENRELNQLYQKVRKLREKGAGWSASVLSELEEVVSVLNEKYPEDWLLRYELLELSSSNHPHLPSHQRLHQQILAISDKSAEKKETVQRGLALLSG